MAYATETRTSTTGVTQFFGGLVAMVSDYLAKRKVYNQTVRELELMTNRELADLGISRSMIKRLAIEAARAI